MKSIYIFVILKYILKNFFFNINIGKQKTFNRYTYTPFFFLKEVIFYCYNYDNYW